VFGSTAQRGSVAAPPHPLMEFTCRSECYVRRVARILVRVPTAPLAISPALWFSASEHGPSQFSSSTDRLSSTSAFLQSLSRLHLAASPCSRHGTDRHLSWALRSLQHIPASRVHLPRAVPVPATFRLQGLVTLLTGYSPRNLAGPVSSRQRPWDSSLRSVPLPQGGRRVSATAEPACR
jgi:hypothetical protein